MNIHLTKGNIYPIWPVVECTSGFVPTEPEGYTVLGYFDIHGYYQGPDKYGIEPVFDAKLLLDALQDEEVLDEYNIASDDAAVLIREVEIKIREKEQQEKLVSSDDTV